MLKALELIGFKSFADRTRFEFPRGITVVVGPNGSGKSNLVDAVRWVLGEQSAKSLRGKEMADVIFSGSETRPRQSTAEATLIFDNADGLVPIDTREVSVGRRVYASGEGEYILNRQPCRLKDIREVFAGTGVATDAYSIIEQGRVDALLRASPQDRRAIFEEAAGISRFKAKRVEAQRRLERVEQNLLRLADIVEEVEGRLRSVRLQAAKARRFRQWHDRLQELRTQVGVSDWQSLTRRVEGLDRELADVHERMVQHAAAVEDHERVLSESDENFRRLDEEVARVQADLAGKRAAIASLESVVSAETVRGRDLEEAVLRHRRQLAGLSVRAGDVRGQMDELSFVIRDSEADRQSKARAVADEERILTELLCELERLKQESRTRRETYVAQMRTAAGLGHELTALESQAASLHEALEKIRARTVECQRVRESALVESQQWEERWNDSSRRVAELEAQLADIGERLSDERERHSRLQVDLGQLRERQGGWAERMRVLEELESRLEGVSAGAQEILRMSRDDASGLGRSVRGLLAELIHSRLETAGMVDVALGEATGHVVLDDADCWFDLIQTEPGRLRGRVGFIAVSGGDLAPDATLDLTGRPGVIGRADQFVETDVELAPLVRRLLGSTWFVEDLATARNLAPLGGLRARYVTRSGELLTAGLVLVAGPRQPLAGLVSRKSELVEVKRLKTVIESQIAEALRAIDASVARIGEAETQARHLARKRDQETQTRDQTRICMAQAGDLLVRLAEEEQSLADQSGVLTTQAQSAREGLSVIRARLEEIESRLSELDSTLAETTRRVESLEAERALVQGRSTSARVELAKSDQRLEHLLAQVRQLHRDQEERQRVVEEEERHLVEANGRLAASEGAILAAESALAMAYLEKERLSAETTRLASDRDQARTARADLVGRYHALSGEVRAILEEQHQLELVVHQVRLERKTLEDRFREDYQADLARLAVLPPAEGAASREEVSAEIDELRRKIQQLGNVNLDALDELSEVENRHASLSAQYEDLVRAKGSLDQIIQRINVDSRRLFEETLETIRGHFVVLFRKLFGGGQADILVESGVDILESGVDIVALPPGSPPGNKPRSISLLSGGQKTLTCLALLLAIFKSRPSPFCVLDEVDAHLDEPNIERILGVLAEFASFTQFIVITHRKKTMTCADTLYGVTMQESGVSKPVSVRFEDVSEGGHIERSASAALDARAEEGTQAA